MPDAKVTLQSFILHEKLAIKYTTWYCIIVEKKISGIIVVCCQYSHTEIVSYRFGSKFIATNMTLFYTVNSIDAPDVSGPVLGRLGNNSSKPNAKMRVICVGGMPYLCLLALEDMAAGDQVLYNYGIKLPFHDKVRLNFALTQDIIFMLMYFVAIGIHMVLELYKLQCKLTAC